MHQISFRVRYAETDAMGVVHHSRYLPWMEIGRTELMREWGFPYRSWEDKGNYLPLVEANCKYHASAKYDDMVTVETIIEDIKPPYLIFTYKIFLTETQKMLVSGFTKHVCIDKKGKILREPVREIQDIVVKKATI